MTRKKGRGSPAAAAAAAAVAAVEAADDMADKEVTEPTEEEREQDEEIAAAAELAGESSARRPFMRLYRSHPALGGREALLDEIDASVYSRSFVRQNYGGGRYRVEHLKVRAADRKIGVSKREAFEVDLLLPPKHPAALLGGGVEPAPAPASPVAPQSLGDSLNTAVLTLVMDLVRQGSESAKLNNELTRASIDQLRANMVQPREERDPLEMFKSIAELLKPSQAAASPLALLKEMLEVRELMDGGGSREPSALGALTELGPKVLDTVNRALDQRGQPAPATLHQPDGRPVVEVPQPKSEAGPVSMDVVGMLGKWVPYLRQWAEEDWSPGTAAEIITKKIPAGYYPSLVAVLAPDDAVATIVTTFPTLVPFVGWLAELRTELLDSLREQPDDADAGS